MKKILTKCYWHSNNVTLREEIYILHVNNDIVRGMTVKTNYHFSLIIKKSKYFQFYQFLFKIN